MIKFNTYSRFFKTAINKLKIGPNKGQLQKKFTANFMLIGERLNALPPKISKKLKRMFIFTTLFNIDYGSVYQNGSHKKK